MKKYWAIKTGDQRPRAELSQQFAAEVCSNLNKIWQSAHRQSFKESVVVEWDGTPEEHAEDMKRQRRNEKRL